VQVELTMEEIITLTCGIMFFVSFFIAMTVEIKARHTIYRLFLRFISHNTEWQIEPYQRCRDYEMNGGATNNYV
jgi:E3 ubiquitin-protein ligase MARCH1/8